MTTFKHPRGKTYLYDFWWKNRRYTGSTDQLTKADADLVESDIKKRLRQQAWGIAPMDRERSPTFTDWAGHFYDRQRKRLTRPDLLDRTLRMVLAFWGTKPAQNAVQGGPYHNLRLADPILDPEWIEKFDAWMETRGLSGSAKNSYRSAVSGMFTLAMRPAWRKKTGVTVNPFVGVERDPQISRKVTITVEQLQQWIQHSPPHVRLALAIGALAPKLRLASILALKWHVNFDRELQFLTVYDHKTIRSSGAPQVVPIDPQLRDILKPLQKRSGALIAFRGEPVASIRTSLTRAARDAGIAYGRAAVTFHSLRHTMATLLAELGVPDEQRRLVMGHSDLRTTQGYTHLRPQHERAPHAALSAAVQIVESVQGKVQGPPDQAMRNSQRIRMVRVSAAEVTLSAKPLSRKQIGRGRRQNS